MAVDVAMQTSGSEQRNRGTGDRLSRLAEAVLSINEDLDLSTMFQTVLEEARSLTGAQYGAILTFDESGGVRDFVTSGMTQEQIEQIWRLPEVKGLLAHLSEIKRPMRVADISRHPASVGFPKGHPPMTTLLGTPIRRMGEAVGNLYLAEKEGGAEFTLEDEETIVMFASQAALAITNARRYRAEQQAKTDMEALINISPVGVLVFDAKTGHLVSVNEETRRIAGTLRGRGRALETFMDLLTFSRADGREIPFDDLPVTRALRTGKTVRAEEVVIHLEDGRAITTLVNARPIRSEDGEITSVVATLQDITPLEEMERQRAEFLGLLSHEMRTPLAAIKGSIATLLNSSTSLAYESSRQFLRIMDEQANLMNDIINYLQDVTRIQAGTLPIDAEPLDVRDVIGQAAVAFQVRETGNAIEMDFPEGLPRIGADRQRVLQVLHNLYFNVSKLSPEESTIRVRAEHEGLYVTISVFSEGGEIPPRDLPHIFKMFSRLRGEGLARESEGMDLGLAICKGIVEAHGGRIWVESNPEAGIRASFTLPVADVVEDGGTSASRPPPSAQVAPIAKERATIVVADGDPRVLRHARETLFGAGYTSIVTGSLEDAPSLLEANNPDLLLLGVEGLDIVQLGGDLDQLPVVLMFENDRDITGVAEVGAADYIVKPFSATELLVRVRSVLRERMEQGLTESTLRPYRAGTLEINYDDRVVLLGGRQVSLTATEYRLLVELSVNAGRVLTHEQLLRRVWGQEYAGDTRPLRTYIKDVRRKLGDDADTPTYIFTEPRVGYRMARPD